MAGVLIFSFLAALRRGVDHSFPAACSCVSRTYSRYCNLVLTLFVRDVFYVRLHLIGHFGRRAPLAELEEHLLHDWLC